MTAVPPGAHLPDHPEFLWRNPEPKKTYDVVIVGGGTAGARCGVEVDRGIVEHA